MLFRRPSVPVARIGRSVPESRIRGAGAGPRSALIVLAATLLQAGAHAAGPAIPHYMPQPCAGGPCGSNPGNLAFVGNAANPARPDLTAATAWDASRNTLNINQLTDKAILNWASFNVAPNTTVAFNQPGSASTTLNRIWQADPSLIQGRMTAPGQVYLINQNGIIFGAGSQTVVGGLLASTLNIQDKDYLGSLFDAYGRFDPLLRNQDAQGVLSTAALGDVLVEGAKNGLAAASIQTTGIGGRVLLAGPTVTNAGSIQTPDGQTILAAGNQIYVNTGSGDVRGLVVAIDGGGAAQNLGAILAQRGNITIAGLTVNQDGLARATSSVNFNGSVYLVAADGAKSSTTNRYTAAPTHGGTLTLGPGSRTEVLPDLTDTATAVDTQPLNPGVVSLQAYNIALQSGSSIAAPGGTISLTARADLSQASPSAPVLTSDAGSIDIAAGASIDASGTQHVALSATRNFVTAQLRGNELQDSPVQKNGFLYTKNVVVDVRGVDANGNIPVANVAGYVAGIGRTIAERTAAGGTITLDAGSRLDLHAGATLNISGGSLDFQSGYAATSTLLGADGKHYDIMSAPKDMTYVGFGDTFTLKDSKWNQSWTYHGSSGLGSQFVAGYVEGRNAGTLSILATQTALDGAVLAHTVRGPNQRQVSPLLDLKDPANWSLSTAGQQLPPANLSALEYVQAPVGGKLQLGDAQTIRTQDLVLVDPATPAAALAQPSASTTVLPVTRLVSEGIAQITVNAAGSVSVPLGTQIDLPAGGSLTLGGNQIEIAGSISAPAGAISLQARQPDPRIVPIDPTQPAPSLTVAAGSTLSTRGNWVNDSAQQLNPDLASLKAIDGGAADPARAGKFLGVALSSAGDLTLAAGSLIDVSGGAYVAPGNALTAGNPGAISISQTATFGGALTLDATLRGVGLASGGSLAITVPQLRIGSGPQAAGEFLLSPTIVAQGGFRNYSFTGASGVLVDAGAVLDARAINFNPVVGYTLKATGSDLFSFASPALLPAAQRNNPESITLATTLPLLTPDDGSGAIQIGRGAQIVTDPGGAITLKTPGRIYVDGTLEAPSGAITLTIDQSSLSAIGYRPQQSIWLGADARLLAPEAAQLITLDAKGLRHGGLINDGGNSVKLDAQRGFIVAEVGALVDVSGTATTVDLTQANGHVLFNQALAGSGGSITLNASAGILFDGAMAAARGAVGGAGGTLAVALDQGMGGYPSGSNLGAELAAPSEVDRIILSDARASQVPVGVRPGAVIDPTELLTGTPVLGGTAVLSTALISEGNFDRVTLRARDAVELHGAAHLAVKQSLQIDAPQLIADPGSVVDLAAAYLSIGQAASNAIPAAPATPAVVSGSRLTLHGQQIDVIGDSTVSGFDAVALSTPGDIRLIGTDKADGKAPSGSLAVAGALTLDAAQVYPTTLSQVTVSATDSVAIRNSAGAQTAVPWSAGGKLVVAAPVIDQQGTLRAPFGEIDLSAGTGLSLGSASLTSVSAAGATIAFGQTQNGSAWEYPMASSLLSQSGAPFKAIRLAAGGTLDIQSKAAVDLSGGGDLLAYEFTAGPGGSKDILAQANTFAIVPNSQYAHGYAPYDPLYASMGTSVRPGDSVYLSAGPFAPGMYTLLPAHFALLPGAYAIRYLGGADAVAGAAKVQADGSSLVAGKRAVAGSDVIDSRWSAWQILPAATIHAASQLDTALASTYYPAAAAKAQLPVPVLPADTGTLALSAGQGLTLAPDASFGFAPGSGGRGGEVDFEAAKLAVVSSQIAGDPGLDGFLQLEAGVLNRFGAERVVLGATRVASGDASQGDALTVSASQVIVRNDAAHPLQAQDLVLAATGILDIQDGSALATVRDAGAFTAPVAIHVAGDGALVRLTEGSLPGFSRTALGNAGQLTIGAGVTLRAGAPATAATASTPAMVARTGSLTLDASSSATLDPTAVLNAPELRVDASSIALGTLPAGTAATGVALASSALANASRLYLQSASSIDLYGAVALGSAAQPLLDLVLDTPVLRGIGAGERSVQAAGTVTLTASKTGAADPAASGSGSLTVTAGDIVIGSGTQRLSGFESADQRADHPSVVLAASHAITANGAGQLDVGGDLTLSAGQITAAAGAVGQLSATGILRVTSGAQGVPAAPTSAGGKLLLTAARIEHGGNIVVPAGQIELHATGTAPQVRMVADPTRPGAFIPASLAADVVVEAGASIAAPGYQKTFKDVVATASGGAITLHADTGNVIAQAGAVLDVGAAGGSDAGVLNLSAPQGTVDLGARLNGTAAGGHGGTLAVDAAAMSAPTFEILNADQASGGFTESYTVRTRTGDLAVSASEAIAARTVTLTADSGNIQVAGHLVANADASRSDGGSIALWAGQGVTLISGASLAADADVAGSGQGGRITLGTQGQSGGMIDVQPGSTVSAAGGTGASNGVPGVPGLITLRAPRTGGGAGTDVAVLEMAGAVNTGNGTSAVTVEAVQTYGTGGTSVTLDNNFLQNVAGPDNASFMNNEAAILQRLGSAGGASLQLLPGVEVVNPALNADQTNVAAGVLDFASLRSGANSVAGALTVRSASDLTIAATLNDGFASASPSASLLTGSSWTYRLVAGADLGAANPTAVRSDGLGSLVLQPTAMVRTGTGDISLAAAGDVSFQGQQGVGASVYTAGVASPYPTNLANFVAPSYISTDGQGATSAIVAQYSRGGGSIDVSAGGNVLGSASHQVVDSWLYRTGSLGADGGFLQLPRVGRAKPYNQTSWWVQFGAFGQDLGALGGGNIRVRAGGSVTDLSASIPTNGRLGGGLPLAGQPTPAPDAANLYVEGGGNLVVTAGGSILGGAFYVEQGSGLLSAAGAIGNSTNPAAVGVYAPLLALGNASFDLRAGGDLSILAAYNPSLAPQSLASQVSNTSGSDTNQARASYFSTYDPGSRLSLSSTAGSVTLGEGLGVAAVAYLPSAGFIGAPSEFSLLPPTVSATALQGNLKIASNFTLAPAAAGNLTLLAGQSIDLRGNGSDCTCTIALSDVALSGLPTASAPLASGALAAAAYAQGVDSFAQHALTPLHAGDAAPVRVYADAGSIEGTPGGFLGTAILAGKQTRLSAAQDISGVSLFVQNLNPTDVTLVSAGRDLIEPRPAGLQTGAKDQTELLVYGPGQFTVQAGRNLDIGTAVGVLTSNNSYQPDAALGANLSLYAGLGAGAGGARTPDYAGFAARYIAPQGGAATQSYAQELVTYMATLDGQLQTLADRTAFVAAFQALPITAQAALAAAAWVAYSSLSDLQKAPLAEQVLAGELRSTGLAHTLTGASYQRGYDAIAQLFPGSGYAGDLSLVYSQVKTLHGGDLGLFTPGGGVNAGLANTPPGAVSKAATDLGIVTQRTGTIRGVTNGNFQVNSSRVFTVGGGDILLWSSQGNIDAGKGAKTTVLIPPPVVTIHPDGRIDIASSGASSGSGIGALITGPGDIPGNVDLIAPVGAVDAGDAGIRASGNLNIAAARVVNAANIQVGGSATGVPPESPTSIASSLPTGNSSSAAGQATEDSNRRIADTKQTSDELASVFKPTFVTVDVIADDEGERADEGKGRKKAKD